MKMLKTALCAAVASVAMAGAAQAQEVDVAFNVGVASDYIFRGLDQSLDQEGQFFGGVDVTVDKFYGGVWVSNTGPDNEQAVEYDLYAGFKPTLGGATLDLGLIYYGYTDSDNNVISSDLDALEFKVGASIPAGPFTLGAAAYYSPENGGFSDESTLYIEANAAYTFEAGPTVSAAVGNFSADVPLLVPDNYTTFNVGVTFPIAEKFSVDLRYHGTNDDAELLFGPEIADDHFVVTGKFVF
jgi:uncharacterized protein (TIGR02001 family)